VLYAHSKSLIEEFHHRKIAYVQMVLSEEKWERCDVCQEHRDYVQFLVGESQTVHPVDGGGNGSGGEDGGAGGGESAKKGGGGSGGSLGSEEEIGSKSGDDKSKNSKEKKSGLLMLAGEDLLDVRVKEEVVY
jgi:hypothetical protein